MTMTATEFETRTEPLFDPGDIREFFSSRPFFQDDEDHFYCVVAERLDEYLQDFGINWHITKPIPADVLRRAVLAAEADDILVESGEARVIVAADSVGHLRGCEVDYSDDLTDAGFKIHNPNAARSCGCGTSFETADAPPGMTAVADGEACGNA